MSNLVIPQGYTAPLPNYEQQRAIAFIKESFQPNLSNVPSGSTSPALGARTPRWSTLWPSGSVWP